MFEEEYSILIEDYRIVLDIIGSKKQNLFNNYLSKQILNDVINKLPPKIGKEMEKLFYDFEPLSVEKLKDILEEPNSFEFQKKLYNSLCDELTPKTHLALELTQQANHYDYLTYSATKNFKDFFIDYEIAGNFAAFILCFNNSYVLLNNLPRSEFGSGEIHLNGKLEISFDFNFEFKNEYDSIRQMGGLFEAIYSLRDDIEDHVKGHEFLFLVRDYKKYFSYIENKLLNFSEPDKIDKIIDNLPNIAKDKMKNLLYEYEILTIEELNELVQISKREKLQNELYNLIKEKINSKNHQFKKKSLILDQVFKFAKKKKRLVSELYGYKDGKSHDFYVLRNALELMNNEKLIFNGKLFLTLTDVHNWYLNKILNEEKIKTLNESQKIAIRKAQAVAREMGEFTYNFFQLKDESKILDIFFEIEKSDCTFFENLKKINHIKFNEGDIQHLEYLFIHHSEYNKEAGLIERCWLKHLLEENNFSKIQINFIEKYSNRFWVSLFSNIKLELQEKFNFNSLDNFNNKELEYLSDLIYAKLRIRDVSEETRKIRISEKVIHELEKNNIDTSLLKKIKPLINRKTELTYNELQKILIRFRLPNKFNKIIKDNCSPISLKKFSWGMKYLGSKRDFIDEFSKIFNDIRKDMPLIYDKRTKKNRLPTYVEPFVGSGIMISAMRGKRIGADNNKFLIELFKAIQKRYWLPDIIEKEEYEHIKKHWKGLKDNENYKCNECDIDYPAYIIGYTGLTASHNGDWFLSYARGKNNNEVYRNFVFESKKNLMLQYMDITDFSGFDEGVNFEHSNYKDLKLPKERCLIYSDAPYRGSITYKGTNTNFNYNEYYRWLKKISKKHYVLISEYDMGAYRLTPKVDKYIKINIDREFRDNIISLLNKDLSKYMLSDNLYRLKKGPTEGQKVLTGEQIEKIIKLSFVENPDFICVLRRITTLKMNDKTQYHITGKVIDILRKNKEFQDIEESIFEYLEGLIINETNGEIKEDVIATINSIMGLNAKQKKIIIDKVKVKSYFRVTKEILKDLEDSSFGFKLVTDTSDTEALTSDEIIKKLDKERYKLYKKLEFETLLDTWGLTDEQKKIVMAHCNSKKRIEKLFVVKGSPLIDYFNKYNFNCSN